MTFGEYLIVAKEFLRQHPEAENMPVYRNDVHCERDEAHSGPSLDHETEYIETESEDTWIEGVDYRIVPIVLL